ncbi:CPBP family intramembrane glutamic endopeptidase [Corynebacterium sp. MSK004]|uniref:CPBP family intramembrane glutamic endopeptidase n=1 Tax=Corynebacterium sp. MSK004 TaxID=3050186 RepID=UPI00254CD9EB|nr:CPBP family intramembrane glutamic endopeptidase [Corynebacterium sp. MSK004]MDK8896830.1 CPBP family intramembrane metalloprotease [Corynebacterium sp. MSK004]
MIARSRLYAEILIVLTITFGISGVRAALRLTDSLLNPAPLNEQSVTINASQSATTLLDLAFQLCSAAVLFAWGALALYLISSPPRPQRRDGLHGAALAAVIGLPGLALYYIALHFGWTKEVVPGAFDTWIEIPVLLIKSFANAWAEELVVVYWLMTRLKQSGWALPATLAASSILRGSYHLYQGVSAGFGNIIMGVVYGWYFHRTGKVWPLVIAHFLIDAIAFVGYALLFGA